MSKFMKILAIQTELNAPKLNRSGQYNSRSKEDILASIKPLLLKEKCFTNLSDEIIVIDGVKTMKTIATLLCAESGEVISTSVGFCSFIQPNKVMDEAKVSGACSSYAGKYALCNLLGIDGQVDHDYVQPAQQVVDVNIHEFQDKINFVIEKAKDNKERTDYILQTMKIESLKEMTIDNSPANLIDSLYKNWSK